MTLVLNDKFSGLLHHGQDKGQPLKNTMVRMPGPSFNENFWIPEIIPLIAANSLNSFWLKSLAKGAGYFFA
jgi:hypothetical protein